MTGLAQLISVLALVLSFGLLCTKNIVTFGRLCALQALCVSGVLEIQGWTSADYRLVMLAPIAFALNGVSLPLVMQQRIQSAELTGAKRFGAALASTVAAALVVLSVSVAMHIGTGAAANVVSIALSLLLAGFLVAVQQTSSYAVVFGFISAQNGVLLATSVIRDLPIAALLAVFVPVIPCLLTARVWLCEEQHRADVIAP